MEYVKVLVAYIYSPLFLMLIDGCAFLFSSISFFIAEDFVQNSSVDGSAEIHKNYLTVP